MKPEDIDQLLESGRYKHLSEETLVSYRDNQLDKIRVALADAHLRLCLICNDRLDFLKEEAEAVANYVITEEDRAAIQQTVRDMKAESNAPVLISTEIQRLTAYIKDMLTAWSVVFSQPAMRGVKDGDEVFRHESKDGLFTVRVMLETDASLTFHFSSPELAWDGAQLRFRLGRFDKKVTLQREEDSRVAARIEIPRRERARKMNDISLEIVGISGATRKIL
jgi:hypothetical protein